MQTVTASLGAFQGYAYGLQQPSVAGALSLRLIDRSAAQAVGQQLRRLMPAPMPAPAFVVENAFDELVLSIVGGAMAIQRECRLPVSGRYVLRGNDAARCEYFVALPCVSMRLLSELLEWLTQAVTFLTRSKHPRPMSVIAPQYQALCRRLREFGEQRLNPFHMQVAAHDLGIPVTPLPCATLSLGHGRNQCWFSSSVSEHTSSIGVQLARDKFDCAAVLRRLGLPVPRHERVRDTDGAVCAAERLGYPVVIKPADREQGTGVSAHLINADQVRQAYATAVQASENVLLEEHINGFTHRLTVVNGRLIKVARRVAGGVVGDGTSSIQALVHCAQQTPVMRRRSVRAGHDLLQMDDEARSMLTQQGLDSESIPAAGEYIRLRRRDNINAGGSNETVPTAEVHPENRELALRVANTLGLDFAGIDLITADISQSWQWARAAICEVNAQPQIGTSDSPRIHHDWMRKMFPEQGRIPVRIVITPASVNVIALSEQVLALWPGSLIARGDGLWSNDQRIAGPYPSGFAATQAALALRETASLIAFVTLDEAGSSGLPVDHAEMLLLATAEHGPDQQRGMAILKRIRENVGEVRYLTSDGRPGRNVFG